MDHSTLPVDTLEKALGVPSGWTACSVPALYALPNKDPIDGSITPVDQGLNVNKQAVRHDNGTVLLIEQHLDHDHDAEIGISITWLPHGLTTPTDQTVVLCAYTCLTQFLGLTRTTGFFDPIACCQSLGHHGFTPRWRQEQAQKIAMLERLCLQAYPDMPGGSYSVRPWCFSDPVELSKGIVLVGGRGPSFGWVSAAPTGSNALLPTPHTYIRLVSDMRGPALIQWYDQKLTIPTSHHARLRLLHAKDPHDPTAAG